MLDEEDEIDGPEEGAPSDPHAWSGAEPKQSAFLTAFVTCGGRVSWAARAARISRTLHYRWHKSDARYQELFADAEIQAGDVLEEEAKRRAYEGYYEPVFYQGEKCGRVLRFSDGLMQTLLKGAKPEKYRENHHIEGNLSHTGISSLTDAELERIASRGRGGATEAQDEPQQDSHVLPG